VRRIAEKPLAQYHPQVGDLWRSRNQEPESEEFDLLPDWMQNGSERPERSDLERVVYYLLTTLTKREALVLLRRYWMDETLDEIGDCLFVSGARVREIEQKALRKLMHPSRSILLEMAIDLPGGRRVGWHSWEFDHKKLGFSEQFLDWIKENPRSSVGYCFPM